MNIDHRLQEPKWSASLCSCGNGDASNCCITCLVPCITFGQIAEILDEGKSSCIANGIIYAILMMCSCHWVMSCVYREKMRTKFRLPSEPCNDCCVHCCCELCALCQEHSELKARGFDPSRGWVAPPSLQPTAPPMPPTMNRY